MSATNEPQISSEASANPLWSERSTAKADRQTDAQKLATSRVPVYAWPLLVLSVLMISSAAPTFSMFPEVSPVLLPAWRTQITTLLLLLPGSLQIYCLPNDEKQKILASLGLIIAAGFSLACDFALWVWGLKETSLSHTLFIGAAGPPVIALGSLVLGIPISLGELGGTALAACGASVLAFGGQSDGGATLFGDALNLIAVLAYVMYFVIGRRVRGNVPVLAYMLLVTGSCTMFLSGAAVLTEGASIRRLDNSGLFGWANTKYIAGVGWLAIGPGIAGHTSINALLRWMHPLQITLPQTMVPIIGSLLGWALGVAPFPHGISTYLGGFLLLTATIIVLTAAHRRETRQQLQAEQVQLPAGAAVALCKPADRDALGEDGCGQGRGQAQAVEPPDGILPDRRPASDGTLDDHAEAGPLLQPDLVISTEQGAGGLHNEGQHHGALPGAFGSIRGWMHRHAIRLPGTSAGGHAQPHDDANEADVEEGSRLLSEMQLTSTRASEDGMRASAL